MFDNTVESFDSIAELSDSFVEPFDKTAELLDSIVEPLGSINEAYEWFGIPGDGLL